MKHDIMIFAIVLLIALVLIGAFAFMVQGTDFFLYKFFAPKREAVRREVFEESKAYRQGMVQELQAMQFDYIKAGEKEKVAMRSIILHRSADFPVSAMPSDLANFIGELK